MSAAVSEKRNSREKEIYVRPHTCAVGHVSDAGGTPLTGFIGAVARLVNSVLIRGSESSLSG